MHCRNMHLDDSIILQSYKNVFKDTKTFGLLSGNSKDTNVDYLFATMQTMSKKEVYSSFAPDTFL